MNEYRNLQLRIMCRDQHVGCVGYISSFVGLGWTIEVKLQTVLLHAIQAIDRDRHRFARKGLNAFPNAFNDRTRGLCGIDDGGRSSNHNGYTHNYS